MITTSQLNQFFNTDKIAIYGLSRSGKGFSNTVMKELTKKDFKCFGINPNGGEVDGTKIYKNAGEITEVLDSSIMIVPKGNSFDAVKDAVASGVKSVWLQQGSETKEAIKYCEENNVNCIYDECILMYAEPVESIHKFHKWIWKLIGKVPA